MLSGRFVDATWISFSLNKNKKLVAVKESSQRPYTLVIIECLEWFTMIHVKFGENTRDRGGVDGMVLKESAPKSWRFKIFNWGVSKNFDCVRFHERQIDVLDGDSYAVTKIKS